MIINFLIVCIKKYSLELYVADTQNVSISVGKVGRTGILLAGLQYLIQPHFQSVHVSPVWVHQTAADTWACWIHQSPVPSPLFPHCWETDLLYLRQTSEDAIAATTTRGCRTTSCSSTSKQVKKCYQHSWRSSFKTNKYHLSKLVFQHICFPSLKYTSNTPFLTLPFPS